MIAAIFSRFGGRRGRCACWPQSLRSISPEGDGDTTLIPIYLMAWRQSACHYQTRPSPLAYANYFAGGKFSALRLRCQAAYSVGRVISMAADDEKDMKAAQWHFAGITLPRLASITPAISTDANQAWLANNIACRCRSARIAR